MNKKLKGILDKLHAAEILSLIPEVSDDTPPAGPNLVWIPVTAMDLLTPDWLKKTSLTHLDMLVAKPLKN